MSASGRKPTSRYPRRPRLRAPHYQLFTVRPPFIGDSPVAVAYQHVREAPQPPSVFRPEIPLEVDAIVLKALAKDPRHRHQSADEMRADIEAYLDGRPVAATAALGAVGYRAR